MAEKDIEHIESATSSVPSELESAEIEKHNTPKQDFQPKITTSTTSKCLTLLINVYNGVFEEHFGSSKMEEATFRNNFYISDEIAQILLIVCEIEMKKFTSPDEGLEIERAKKGKVFTLKLETTYTILFDKVIEIWDKELKKVFLEFKNNKEIWLSNIASYLLHHFRFSAAYCAIEKDHSQIQIENNSTFSIESFGLNETYHVLLEGIRFYPAEKLIFRKSLGPLTVFLQMLMSKELKTRKKWEDVVRTHLSTLSCIDDIITVTRKASQSESFKDFINIIILVSEILLILTSRHTHEIYLPLGMLAAILDDMETSAEKKSILEKFDIFGHEGYYWYSLACNKEWYLKGNFEENEASQLVFHSIFSTFKEDLMILEQISNCKNWYTKKELLEERLQNQRGANKNVSRFKLPILTHYPKWTKGDQKLGGVDYLISNIDRKVDITKYLNNVLGVLVEQQKSLEKEKCTWGTVDWYKMETVATNSSETKNGVDPDFIPRFGNKTFVS